MGDTRCEECKWTNFNLINLGAHDKPRWVCQGCMFEIIQERNRLKRDLAERNAAIVEFVRGQQWAVREWKEQPHIARLFELAAKEAGEVNHE